MSPSDRLYLARAVELARRAVGDTSPNPPVGAVIVRAGVVVGEGYHHRAGEPHAERMALLAAGDARGATAYVSLEPCDHVGRTPPCTQALIDAGVARVVIGAADPNPRTAGAGVARLRAQGIAVDVIDDADARVLIEIFARAIRSERPYLALKMAMSLDGFIASQPGVQEWLTCEEERAYVRELRIAHDAVMVGAGTVRVDDPQLTVRPPHARRRSYVRIVACERDTVPAQQQIFAPLDGYARTIVLAPAGARERFAALRDHADVLFVGGENDERLDLAQAMRAVRALDVQSVLCEGGPRLGARLIEADLVDRLYWAIAPRLLAGAHAVPVLTGVELASVQRRLRFDRFDRAGEDVVLSGTLVRDV